MLSNLPPGVSIRDIPGNRGIDDYSCDVFADLAIQFDELDPHTQDRVWNIVSDYFAEGFSVDTCVKRVHEWLGVKENES